MVRSPNRVLTPLKRASKIRFASFVHRSKIFVWDDRRQLVLFFSTISILNISTKVLTTNLSKCSKWRLSKKRGTSCRRLVWERYSWSCGDLFTKHNLVWRMLQISQGRWRADDIRSRYATRVYRYPSRAGGTCRRGLRWRADDIRRRFATHTLG